MSDLDRINLQDIARKALIGRSIIKPDGAAVENGSRYVSRFAIISDIVTDGLIHIKCEDGSEYVQYVCHDIEYNPEYETNSRASVKQLSSHDLVDLFAKAKKDLEDFKAKNFPFYAPVMVNSQRYEGPGVVWNDENCPPDKLAVRLPNDNVWWYPVCDCEVVKQGS